MTKLHVITTNAVSYQQNICDTNFMFVKYLFSKFAYNLCHNYHIHLSERIKLFQSQLSKLIVKLSNCTKLFI